MTLYTSKTYKEKPAKTKKIESNFAFSRECSIIHVPICISKNWLFLENTFKQLVTLIFNKYVTNVNMWVIFFLRQMILQNVQEPSFLSDSCQKYTVRYLSVKTSVRFFQCILSHQQTNEVSEISLRDLRKDGVKHRNFVGVIDVRTLSFYCLDKLTTKPAPLTISQLLIF